MNSYAHHGLLPTNIPLHCNICPKRPDFSDVSHLLTHIASKGHLSHYYKIKVKASTDHDSQQVVAEYDEWYDEWNVQELMRERMNQKERKQGGSNRSGSRRASAGVSCRLEVHLNIEADPCCVLANSLASNTARNTPILAPRAPRRPHNLRESTLDPQLDRIVIKQEPKSRSTTPTVPFALDPATASRAFEPPMQAWSPFVDSPLTQETSAFDSLYNTPTTDSFEEEMPTKKQAKGRKKVRNLSGSQPSVDMVDGEVEYDPIDDKLTLKGVIWPGMDLFDSATVEMKRKRNQKKDHSVLENLMANSQVIEPTESIFDGEGFELRRERYVTGNPNEDDGLSPLPGEQSPGSDSTASPKPKKKRAPRKPRAPLAKKEANTGRITSRRRAEPHHPPFGNTTRRAPYFDGGADEEDELTYGRQRAPRRGLSIHRDNSGPEITFAQPTSMDVLTSRFPNPFQTGSSLQPRPDSMIQNGYATDGRHNGQPSISMPASFRTARQNPVGNMQLPNFGTFRQLSNVSTWANPSFQNHGSRMPGPGGIAGGAPSGMAAYNGRSAFSTFEQQFPPNNFSGVAINSYQSIDNASFQVPTLYDVFGATNGNVSAPSLPGESSFSINSELTTANPLFFSSTHDGPEDDDQATISPPPTESRRRASGGL